jgi:predicted flap endonuclease-1-like 5' DNA nuclease
MSIITVCRQAWKNSKKDHQPAFDDLIQAYQNMLQQRASGAIASGVANDDGPLASFDLAAIKANVNIEPPEIPPEVKEELVEEVVAEEAPPEPEPEKEHVEPKGPLPKDFPKHDLLHEAGINTYGQLCKIEDLTAIEGIGPETAKKIAKRLKADEKALNK